MHIDPVLKAFMLGPIQHNGHCDDGKLHVDFGNAEAKGNSVA
jgi:hypothetical protein